MTEEDGEIERRGEKEMGGRGEGEYLRHGGHVYL